VLTINGLTIAYGPIQVVHGVTMNVEEGQIVALIGPNGAGKSSVLRAVSGLIRPKAGDITFLGANIVGVPPHEIAIAGVAHVMEGRHLFGGLSVEDNLILAGSRDDKSSAGNLEGVYQRWPRLRERREQLAGTLSGGEQQMLAIGRALVTRPRLLILDEPSWGLAPRIVRELMDTFVKLCREGVTILLCEQMANLALGASSDLPWRRDWGSVNHPARASSARPGRDKAGRTKAGQFARDRIKTRPDCFAQDRDRPRRKRGGSQGAGPPSAGRNRRPGRPGGQTRSPDRGGTKSGSAFRS